MTITDGPVLDNDPATRQSILAVASDIPRSCRFCSWQWRHGRWRLTRMSIDCPWHGKDR